MKKQIKIIVSISIIILAFSCNNTTKKDGKLDTVKEQPNLSAKDILGNPKYLAMSYGGYRHVDHGIEPTLNELKEDLKDNMVTFMAGIFRSVRFGTSSAHGKANMIRFNFFKQMGAFTRNANGTYTVNFTKMEFAMETLSEVILSYQGDGDYEGVNKFVNNYVGISEELQKDLDKLSNADIPVDVVFEQGTSVLGL